MREASRGVFAVMRGRNWVMGLVVPSLAAITVGVAAVVAVGGGGGGQTTQSALAAGFEPARPAGASFTQGASRVVLSAIGVSDSTEVTAGSVNGAPALWTSTDGATDWNRAKLAIQATGQLAGVAHGPAGWLAVGTAQAGNGDLLVLSSPDARTWTAGTGLGTGNAAAVAAGPAGYVVVGHRSAGGSETAAAWSSPGLTGLRPATITADVAGHEPQAMNAVTAVAGGFVAVGQNGTNSAAWLTANGRNWRQVQVPPPAGATRSALTYVAANGETVVAAGTEFAATGTSSPFTEVSTNGGKTWAEVGLPVPATGTLSGGSAVTALTAAAGGFTAAGTYNTPAGQEVVIWTLPPGAPVTNRAAWAEATPQGFGLSSTKSENTLTALTIDGATLTGVGFTAPPSGAGAQEPTLWQSPVRY